MREALRVLSWNIHGGMGPDRRYDLARIANLVASHDPDVIALQEVDSRGRSGSQAPVCELKEALGEHAAEARVEGDKIIKQAEASGKNLAERPVH